MEFDKSKVYTVLNADKSLIGAKGYFADDITDIKECINHPNSNGLNSVLKIENDHIISSAYNEWNFFYLIEPAPSKPKYRPFKDCDELANYSESLHQRTHKFRVDLDMPFIWVKNKNVYTKHLIIDFGDNFCSISHPARNEIRGLTLEELFENYTFLDGSVCGVEE